jgi:hypothetical protein
LAAGFSGRTPVLYFIKLKFLAENETSTPIAYVYLPFLATITNQIWNIWYLAHDKGLNGLLHVYY